MYKERYLRKLRSLLRELPKSERRTIIDFYREMIEDKIENGSSEAQAVAELGDVHVLAQKILAENPNRRHYSGNRIAGIVIASIFGVLIISGLVASTLYNYHSNGVFTVRTGEDSTVKEKTAMAQVSETKLIYLDVSNREIKVNRIDGDEIKIAYTENQNEKFDFTNENGSVKLIKRSSIGFPSGWNLFGNWSSSPITVGVPESYSGELYLDTSNGGISVDNMAHATKITCSSSNGGVVIRDTQAQDVAVDSSNGGIVLKGLTASGTVHVDTSNSGIAIQNLTAPDVALNTSNGSIIGNIIGKEEDYSITTSTSNGSCTPQSRSGGSKRLTADSSNADIRIQFTE